MAHGHTSIGSLLPRREDNIPIGANVSNMYEFFEKWKVFFILIFDNEKFQILFNRGLKWNNYQNGQSNDRFSQRAKNR